MQGAVGGGARTNLSKRAHRALFENSLRLLADANLLFKSERFPSAAALAILSLEEFGKFVERMEFAVAAGRGEPSRQLHVRKQKSISLFLLRVSYFLAAAERLGIDMRISPTKITIVHREPEEARKLLQRFIGDDGRIASTREAMELFATSDRMGDAKWLDTVVRNGRLNGLRNSAFYCDCQKKVVRTPLHSIKPKTAYRLLRICETLVSQFEHVYED